MSMRSLCTPWLTSHPPQIDCNQTYIDPIPCTSEDSHRMKEARLSFPSGHASFSAFTMVYLVVSMILPKQSTHLRANWKEDAWDMDTPHWWNSSSSYVIRTSYGVCKKSVGLLLCHLFIVFVGLEDTRSSPKISLKITLCLLKSRFSFGSWALVQ